MWWWVPQALSSVVGRDVEILAVLFLSLFLQARVDGVPALSASSSSSLPCERVSPSPADSERNERPGSGLDSNDEAQKNAKWVSNESGTPMQQLRARLFSLFHLFVMSAVNCGLVY